MGEFPSGQRGQTVNLLSSTSLVRIQLPPPKNSSHPCGGCYFFVWLLIRSSPKALFALGCWSAYSPQNNPRLRWIFKAKISSSLHCKDEYPASLPYLSPLRWLLFFAEVADSDQSFASFEAKDAGSYVHPKR